MPPASGGEKNGLASLGAETVKICYLDCFSGVSGDMLLGALADAGADADELREGIGRLGLAGLELHFEKCKRSGIGGTNFTVQVEHDHHHRSLSRIEEIIAGSELSELVKERSIRIFRRLGEVEAAIHQIPVEKVHFHEVGALDSITDIVGSCIAFDLLGVEKVYCSPLNLGSGTVEAAHGVMPVPAPATAAATATTTSLRPTPGTTWSMPAIGTVTRANVRTVFMSMEFWPRPQLATVY